MKNIFNNLSKSGQYVVLAFAVLLNVIVWTPIFSSCSKTENKPLTLSQTIAQNVKEHFSDWKITSIKDTSLTERQKDFMILMNGYVGNIDIIENNKCGIKLKYDQYTLGMVYPDTIIFSSYERDEIIEAFTLQNLKKQYSLDSIEDKKKLDKEALIISKICK